MSPELRLAANAPLGLDKLYFAQTLPERLSYFCTGCGLLFAADVAQIGS